MVTILTILGTLITAISFIYAIYANKRHSKLINYNKEQAWELYRQSSKVLGRFQELEQLKINDKEFITQAAKGEAAAQELLLNTIKMIKRFEPEYNVNIIDKWYQEGKLSNESHLQAFKGYVEK